MAHRLLKFSIVLQTLHLPSSGLLFLGSFRSPYADLHEHEVSQQKKIQSLPFLDHMIATYWTPSWSLVHSIKAPLPTYLKVPGLYKGF
jgi:hypothetical protein